MVLERQNLSVRRLAPITMTGEVALRGAVMPIGRLPEKLMAAERSGITKVYIPKENILDLKNVARTDLWKKKRHWQFLEQRCRHLQRQQPGEFFVVANKEKLHALSEVSPYAGTKNAPVAIVAAYRKE